MAYHRPVDVSRNSAAALGILLILLGSGLVAVVAQPSSAGTVSAALTSAASPNIRTVPALSAARPRKPNIVMVMADDMRADDLRWMPQVRKLVGRNGLSFDNSFSPYPLCCPARASFLTGQYAHNHKVWWHEAPEGYAAFDDSRTLATSLRQAGYRTGFVGKYLNRYGPATSRVSGRPSYRYVPRGWDDWRAAIENPGRDGIHGGTYQYYDTPFNVNGKIDNRYRGRYQSTVIGDFSVAMTKRFSQQKNPFFMYVNYVAPHHGGPREPGDVTSLRDRKGNRQSFVTPARPRSVWGKFDRIIDRGAGMPRNGGPAEKNVSDKPRFFRSLPEPSRNERTALRNVTRQRAESIYVMDRNIARLIKQLKKSGEWSNTVFMFTSDNGYYLGEHRKRSGKVRAHEPSFRVPFLVTGPGMRSGETRYEPITTIDASASILDLARAEAPRVADGQSRVATMLGGDRGWLSPVVNEATNLEGKKLRSPGFNGRRVAIGIRTARYSYIRNRTGEHELYDLVRDPLQEKNVFKSTSYRAERRALTRVWKQFKDCDGAQCRKPLPEALQTDAKTTRTMGKQYWRDWRRTYGF